MFLGVDVGTGGTRAILIDRAGRVIASAASEHAAVRSEHIGWGHGSLSSVVSLALDADARKLLLFHHDPSHDDAMVDQIVEQARKMVKKSGKSMQVEGAREGAELLIGAKIPA